MLPAWRLAALATRSVYLAFLHTAFTCLRQLLVAIHVPLYCWWCGVTLICYCSQAGLRSLSRRVLKRYNFHARHVHCLPVVACIAEFKWNE